jgi:hypothetical protein
VLTIFLYFLITWVLISLFCTLQHRSDQLSFLWLYMVLSIITINLDYIRFEKFHLATYPRDYINYFSLILDRSFIVPIFVLFFVYFYGKVNTTRKKLTVILFWTILFSIYDWFGQLVGVRIYTQWTTFYSIIVFYCLVLLALIIKRWFNNQSRSQSL